MDLNLDAASIREALLTLLIAIVSLALHEWGHAAMADRLGDDTPRSQGRVTLNPLVHIDRLGTVIIPLLCALGVFGSMALIGWAKPVQTNPANFKNRIADAAWVTIAGPGLNLLLAAGATVAAAIAAHYAPNMKELFTRIITMNVMLMVFNLLPFPPLDGSKFLMYWGGMSEETYMNLSRWSGFALLILINVPQFRQFLGLLFEVGIIPFNALYHVLV